MKKRIAIVGMSAHDHLLVHALMAGLKINTELSIALDDTDLQEELKKEREKQRLFDVNTVEIKRYHFQEEPEPKVDLSKLHELHPFAKFIGNKRKKW